MKICVFEPASPSRPEDIREAMELFRREYTGNEPPSFSLFGEIGIRNKRLPYLSSSDMEKAAQFRKLATKQEQLVIMFTRGGYGTMRWIGMADLEGIGPRIRQKMFVGFSDTTFLAARLLNLGHTFLHGPMLSTLKNTDTQARRSLYSFLSEGRLPSLYGTGLVPGRCRGRLIGGNLTCLCHTIGTSLEPEWEGAICFIEDCGEDVYRIDRMLTHLIEIGALKKVRGIVTGSFILKSKEQSSVDILNTLLRDRLSGLGKPVVTGVPAGHGRSNMVLLLGSRYELDGSNGALIPLTKNYSGPVS